jgi:hypothetical protein
MNAPDRFFPGLAIGAFTAAVVVVDAVDVCFDGQVRR